MPCVLKHMLLLTLALSLPYAAHTQPDPHNQNPDSALFDAIDREDISALRAALAAGASMQAHDRYGHLPLVAAAAQGNAGLFRVLLDSGADINAQDQNKHSALSQAAFDNQIDIIRLLLPRKPNLDLQDVTGNTAIFYAANRSNREVLELLLNAGANTAVVNNQGHTVLSQAYVDNKSYEITSMLRAAGATFANPTDELYADAATGDIDDLRRMLAAGADLNFKPRNGETPLCVAAFRGNTVAVRILLANGADPKLDDGVQKQSPLFWALVSRHRSTVDALLNAGADPRIRTAGHRTLLVTAAFDFDDPNLLDQFLQAGVDIDESDILQQTPLMSAAQANNSADIKYLLHRGANPSLRDKDGKSAADYAHAKHNDNLAKLLTRAGRDWKTQHLQ